MILQALESATTAGKKQLALLIDPDKLSVQETQTMLETALSAPADLIFVGGSLLVRDNLDACLDVLKAGCDIPVILFPGSPMQVNGKADALLFLSLISGRNPELLIGHHVMAAPYIKASGLEVLPTGYILVEGGQQSTASYISNTTPIPAHKPEIARLTAIAGEMLGLRVMYLDAGSGAKNAVPAEMIADVKQHIRVPLIVGGGIRTPEMAARAWDHGADVVVVGNATEEKALILNEIAAAKST